MAGSTLAVVVRVLIVLTLSSSASNCSASDKILRTFDSSLCASGFICMLYFLYNLSSRRIIAGGASPTIGVNFSICFRNFSFTYEPIISNCLRNSAKASDPDPAGAISTASNAVGHPAIAAKITVCAHRSASSISSPVQPSSVAVCRKYGSKTMRLPAVLKVFNVELRHSIQSSGSSVKGVSVCTAEVIIFSRSLFCKTFSAAEASPE